MNLWAKQYANEAKLSQSRSRSDNSARSSRADASDLAMAYRFKPDAAESKRLYSAAAIKAGPTPVDIRTRAKGYCLDHEKEVSNLLELL